MSRILIVDDNAIIRHLLRQTLESEDYEIVEACNGDEALQHYRATPAEVVITDIEMPKKNGLELIQELQRDWPQVKLIVVCGREPRFLKSIQQLGVQYVFEKPFSVDKIRDAVNALISRQLEEGTTVSLITD